MIHCEACGDSVELAPACVEIACPHRPGVDPMGAAAPLPQADADAAAALDPATFAPALRRLVSSGPELALALGLEVLGVLLGPLAPVVSLSLAVYFALRDQDDSRLSFGKRLTHLRVVDEQTGALATPRQAVVRNLPLVAGFVLAVVPGVEVVGWGLLALTTLVEGAAVLLDPRGRRLGDRLAGTRVVGVEDR